MDYDLVFDLVQQACDKAKIIPEFADEAGCLEQRLYDAHDMLIRNIALLREAAPGEYNFDPVVVAAYGDLKDAVIDLGERMEAFWRSRYG